MPFVINIPAAAPTSDEQGALALNALPSNPTIDQVVTVLKNVYDAASSGNQIPAGILDGSTNVPAVTAQPNIGIFKAKRAISFSLNSTNVNLGSTSLVARTTAINPTDTYLRVTCSLHTAFRASGAVHGKRESGKGFTTTTNFNVILKNKTTNKVVHTETIPALIEWSRGRKHGMEIEPKFNPHINVSFVYNMTAAEKGDTFVAKIVGHNVTQIHNDDVAGNGALGRFDSIVTKRNISIEEIK